MTSCKICGTGTQKYISNLFDDRYGYPKYFDVFFCARCGLYQTHPPLRQEEIADLYTHYYLREDIQPKKMGENFRPEQGRFLALSRWLEGNHRIQYELPPAHKKILEIGCGDGRSLLQLRALGYDAYGIEADENVGRVGEELKLNIHIGTIENSGFEQKTFDCIIANQLIEHIIDLDSFLESCKTLLKDDGVMIFSTPNAGSIYKKLCGRKWINWHIPFHQQVFTKKSVALLFNKHGLSILKIKTVTPTSWTLHQLHALRNAQTIGIKNPYWNKKEAHEPEREKKNSGMVKKLMRLPKRMLFVAIIAGITLTNRIIDATRQGDCLMIYIRKSS